MKTLTPNSREWKLKKLALLKERASRWRPLPGPQSEAFGSLADITGYGGAAGGGKSDLLIGLSSSQHTKSVIFRREATQNDDLYDRAKDIIRTGHFNDTKKWVRMPPDRKLDFAGVKDPNDVLKWRGRPHDFIGFDEATEFLEKQVKFLSGWLRTTKKGQRCRVVLTFNPPTTAEGRWVIRYFGPWLDKNYIGRRATPGELRWFAQVKGEEVECFSCSVCGERGAIGATSCRDESGNEIRCSLVPDGSPFEHEGRTIVPLSRTFIPARMTDNPHLMATDYWRQVDNLPEPLRSQLLYGDFDAGTEDDEWQVIPTAWIDAAVARWREGKRPEGPITAYGADIARGGKDRTTFAPRLLNWFDPIKTFPGSQTPTGMAVVELMSMEPDAGEAIWNIDVIGVGSSAFDIATQNGFNAIAMNGAAGSDAKTKSNVKFANKRAEWYWKLREDLDPQSGTDLAIPDDPELIQDLTAPRWSLGARGILVEPKDEIKKRIGRSPDKGDALVNAHATNFPSGWAVVDFYEQMAKASEE